MRNSTAEITGRLHKYRRSFPAKVPVMNGGSQIPPRQHIPAFSGYHPHALFYGHTACFSSPAEWLETCATRRTYKKPVNTSVYGLFPAPRVGLEPTTTRLTAECSTIELSRIILLFKTSLIQRAIPSKPNTVLCITFHLPPLPLVKLSAY